MKSAKKIRERKSRERNVMMMETVWRELRRAGDIEVVAAPSDYARRDEDIEVVAAPSDYAAD